MHVLFLFFLSHARTRTGKGGTFGDLSRGPREQAKVAPVVVATADCVIFCMDHIKYWSLAQGQKEADDLARRIGV